MTRGNESTIREALTSISSPTLIRRRAKKLRAVKRERRVDIVALSRWCTRWSSGLTAVQSGRWQAFVARTRL